MANKELLDFTIYSDRERRDYIEQQIEKLGRNPTANELALFANYILYGKSEEDGLSVVDKGYVSIPTKYSSYRRKGDKVVSLDELRENPAFDERAVRPLGRDPYKHPRQALDKTMPELEPLRQEIAKLQHVYDVAIGKAPPDPSLPLLNQTQIYHLNHQLISLKSQQYIVKDSAAPTLGVRAYGGFSPYTPEPLEFWPLGAYFGTERVRFDHPRRAKDYDCTYGDMKAVKAPDRLIDFTNPRTIKTLIEHYGDLLEYAIDRPTSDAAQLIATLDWYEAKAHLPPSRHDLYLYKKGRWPNGRTRDRLNADYGKSYNENYVSTIYTRDVCGAIAAAAKLHYLQWKERDNPAAWKKCAKCGEWHLKAQEFHKRLSSSDGYAAQCIWCEADKRYKKIIEQRDARRKEGKA